MSIISQRTWDNMPQEEKDKIRERWDTNEKFCKAEYNIELEDIFGKHNLRPQLTYDDVAKELYNSSAGTFGIPERDFSKKSDVKPWDYFGVYSKEAQQKVIAIRKLLNVAKFLNKNEDGTDWVPDRQDGMWTIGVNRYDGTVIPVETGMYNYGTEIVYFRTREIALQAIKILGEDTVKLALTTNW